MKRTCGLYQILNKTTGVYYVGSSNHVYKRLRHHKCQLRGGKHHNANLQKAWGENGSDSFDFLLLKELPKEERLSAEQAMLDNAFSSGIPIYNIAKDVNSFNYGREVSKETRLRLSVAQKKAIAENRSGSFRGRHHTEASKKLLAAHRLGSKLSIEHRNKISKGLMGIKRPRSPEHAAKIWVTRRANMLLKTNSTSVQTSSNLETVEMT